jgi:hypothetical protein
MREHRLAEAIGWCGVLAMATLAGCARGASSGAPHAPAPAADSSGGFGECWLAPAALRSSDSLLIVVDHRAGAIDDGRRLIESLTAFLPVRADCAGRAVPALSLRWQADSAQPHRLVPIAEVSGVPVLRIASLEPGADARDAIDRGADLLITQDPGTVRYAAARGDRLIVPLPARWTYGVLTITGESPFAPRDRLTPQEMQALRESLAWDVVPAAAVAARGDPDAGPVHCSMSIGLRRHGSAGTGGRLVHRADDPVARALAERLVSLAARPGDTAGRLLAPEARSMAAAGVDSATLAAELSAGGPSEFVIAWPSAGRDVCASLGSVRIGEPRPLSEKDLAPALEVTPLIEVAAWAIVRRGMVGLMRDAAGETRLVVTIINPATSSP